jgi:hypothetical protein
VRGDDRGDAGCDRGGEGAELDGAQPIGGVLDHGQLVMRVDVRIAVAWKVLAARGDPGILQLDDDGPPELDDSIDAFGQRTIADNRVLRVGEHVDHRRKIQRHAYRGELVRKRPRKPASQCGIAGAPQRDHRRPFREWSLQARDAASFLIDRHPRRQLGIERLNLTGHFGDLLWILHVPLEQHDAANRELSCERTQLHRHVGTVESGHEELAHMLTKAAGGHL